MNLIFILHKKENNMTSIHSLNTQNSGKNLFYFFDGTGVNIDSRVEKKFGRSVVGELFDLNKSQHGYIGAKFGNPNQEPIITNIYEDGRENISFFNHKNIKFYFPGPGAESCLYKNKLYEMPGRESVKIYLNNIKSYRFSILNQIYGNGWEHNETKALICAASLSNSKFDRHFIIGYSRGGITAISFSKKLSEMRGCNDIYLFLIDPVAGGNYSKIDNLYEKSLLDKFFSNRQDIIPYFIGKSVKHAVIFYACTENRLAFKPQMPTLRQGRYANYKRKLFFPENTSADIWFMYADHQQIAYKEYKNTKQIHAAGYKVYNVISEFINKKISSYLYPHSDNYKKYLNYDDSYTVPFAYSKEDREIKNEVFKDKGSSLESYSRGELFKINPYKYL